MFFQIQNLLENKSFETFFTHQSFEQYYLTRLRGRRSAGRDRISADAFFKNVDLNELQNLCINGSYKFSVYNEHLLVKGRGRYPRVISIPTMRDRLILGILNQYLQDKLPDCVERKPVNQLIHQIKLYKATHPNRTIRFFKTDYSSFYDNIDRKRLIQQLKDRDIDSRAINLVRDAIENPTCGGTRVEAEAAVVEPYGIPQGLSISNLLSSLYVREIDEEMKKTSELFIRYVDDIIILQPFQEDFDSLTQNYADKINLHLQLNPDKTKYGILGVDELEFLGYSFTDKGVTVKRTNVTNFLNRIAKECLNFRRLYKNKVLRPNYLEDDEVFVHTRLFLLDFSLKGIKVNGKYYGWLHHFQEIDDIGLLYMIDRRIRKQMLSFLPQKYLKQVSSLRKIYFQLMDGKADKVVYNYDNLKDVHQRRAYLIKRGLLDQFKTYSDEEIDLLFIRDREMIIKRNEANIGHKY